LGGGDSAGEGLRGPALEARARIGAGARAPIRLEERGGADWKF
jgi:hypothetical protein